MGFFGDLFGKGEEKGAKQALATQKEMQRKWENLVVPSTESMLLDLPDYAYNPQQEAEQMRTYQAEDTAMGDIISDPQLREAQVDTLNQMQAIADDPSLSDIDKAQLYEILRTQEASARGARDAEMQSAAERGISGSGLELVNRMMANQGAADRGSAGGYALAGQAEQRRRDALSSVGRLAGGIREQDYGEQADVAKARDMIDKFNIQQQTAAEQTNVDARNRITGENIARGEREAQTNYGARTDEAVRRADIPGMQFNMESGKLSGMQGTANQVGGAQLAKGAAKGTASRALLSTAGQIATGVGTAMMASDVRMKENIEPIGDDQAREMMGDLTGYKYNYKDPDQYGEGEQMGVMAQDLEQSPMGAEMVIDTPEGKMVEFDPNQMMALMASLNSRISKMEGR